MKPNPAKRDSFLRLVNRLWQSGRHASVEICHRMASIKFQGELATIAACNLYVEQHTRPTSPLARRAS